MSSIAAPRGARSGTPERPTDAVEVLPTSRLVHTITELLRIPPRRKQVKSTRQRSRKKTKRPSEHRNGTFRPPPASPIDTLASVAAFQAQSNSPNFNSTRVVSNNFFHYSPLLNNYSNAPDYDSRPSKRARSEVLPSPLQTSPRFDQTTARPTTSYNGLAYNVEHGIDNGRRMGAFSHSRHGSANGTVAYQQSNVDEAELLMNFARGGSTSEALGLGISAHNAPAPQAQQRVPALPPFPYGLSGNAAGNAGAPPRTESSGGAAPDVHMSPPQAISTPRRRGDSNGHLRNESAASAGTNLAQSIESGALSNSEGTVIPEAAAAIKSAEISAQHVEPEVESQQRAPAVPSPEDIAAPEVASQPVEGPASSNTSPKRKEPAGAQESDNHVYSPISDRRRSISQGPSMSRLEKPDEKSRSSSVPLGGDEVAEADAEKGAEKETVAESLRLHEQGIICPACKFAADVMSEKVDWMQCDGCDQWYHAACAGYNAKQSERIDKYFCKPCQPKHGKTTFKRKSQRTRTTVDYAGLNEGVLRPSEENREHHYIEAIKSGELPLTPETFPRMPGSMITLDFFEKCQFSEPIVIPKSMNPRPPFPGTAPRPPSVDDDHELVPDDGQDDMDMVIPQELTVRRVSELYGPKNQIPVIDVKEQESSKGWTVEKWADYYESPSDKPIRNVISLECSTTPLCRLIRRPKLVRDLDLQDQVWPDTEWRKSVGFYVLMSVADCFTDFHIDFGGSSVYYHILKGKKVFFFIPPTPSNLQKYQDWNDMPSQNWTWLPDQTKTKECYRVDLYPGDTMLIPAGWIHAVWTPEDSLVIGGNFLTRLHYSMQFKVAEIEKNNKTPAAFKYPKFQKVMWYAVLQYLEQDPLPEDVKESFLDGKQFERATPIWCEFNKFGENSNPGRENYNARYYSRQELEGLPDMVNYIFRTVMIYMDRLENISAQTRKAVTESIPKGRGEPLEIARDFAMWVAWKRGKEDIPEWAHPGAVLPNKPEEPAEKKLSDAQLKKMQKASAISAPERQSARLKSVAEATLQQEQLTALMNTPKTSSLGPRRTACDSCRKRKMRCKHVENPGNGPPIFFANPETSPQSNFITIPPQPPQPLSSYPTQFAAEPANPFVDNNGLDMQEFMSAGGPKQEITELKKGRTKACYDCRRSKRRCIHDEFGRIDPIKQREPVVPRGSAKRKQGPSPEMPLAKKPAHEQVAPVAPMVTGQQLNFDSSPSAPSTTVNAWAGNSKQDGMFRNSTVNDFTGVNVNPLASRNGGRPSTNGNDGQQDGHAFKTPSADWALDPALTNQEPEYSNFVHEDQQMEEDYTDAQDALMAYYQSTNAPNALEQQDAPTPNGEMKAEPEIDPMLDPMLESLVAPGEVQPSAQKPPHIDGDAMDIDPSLSDAVPQAKVAVPSPAANGGPSRTSHTEQQDTAGAVQAVSTEQTNGILPSTEDSGLKRQSTREAKEVERFAPETNGTTSPAKRRRSSVLPQTPIANGTGSSRSPEVGRGRRLSGTPGKPSPGSAKAAARLKQEEVIEETDEDTMRLIEQLRQEDMGLRRRSGG